MQQQHPVSREELRALLGREIVVTAVYVRTAPRHSARGDVEFSIQLRDVQLAATGKPLTDHIWLPLVSSWQAQRLAPGDYLQFASVVGAYRKGYQGQTDCRSRTTQLRLDFGLEPVSAPQLLARG